MYFIVRQGEEGGRVVAAVETHEAAMRWLREMADVDVVGELAPDGMTFVNKLGVYEIQSIIS